MVTSGNTLINHARAQIIQDIQENMSGTLSDRRKTKELRVLELYDQGYSYRKIASLVKVSLRDVSKYIHRISNKKRSPSSTSVMDEVALEYRVTGLRRELRDLEILRENLKSEVNDLRAQLLNAQYQLRAKRSELDAVKRNLEYERFSEEILKDIVTEASDHLT